MSGFPWLLWLMLKCIQSILISYIKLKLILVVLGSRVQKKKKEKN